MLRNIAIVDCAVKEPSHQCFNQFVERTQIPCSYHLVSTHGIGSLETLKHISAIIILGSYSHVHERLSWQIELSNFCLKKLNEQIPVLGICFGHQLMIDKLGGTIDFISSENNKQQGVREVMFNHDFGDILKDDKKYFIVSHKCEVKSAPPDLIAIASSSLIKFEVVAHKKLPFIGIQAHPEASKQFIKSTLENSISDNCLQNARISGDQFLDSFIKKYL